MRYKELVFQGKTEVMEHKIDEILVKKGFGWVLDAEVANARMEITESPDGDIFVWNGGIWYNGTWKMGVWRDGTWKFGTWIDGVFYNGTWEDGLFKNGILGSRTHNTKPVFYHGQIMDGEIQSGEVVDADISPSVKVLNKPRDNEKRDF